MSFNTAIQQMVAIARAVVVRGEARHHGRADLLARRARGRGAVRRHPPAQARRACRSSSSATSSTSSTPSATASRSCATGAPCAVAPMARDRPKLELVAAMLGRDLAQVTRRGRRDRPRRRRTGSASALLEAEASGGRPPGADVQLRRCARGEIVGLAGLLGSGPHRDRARGVRRRPGGRRRDPRSTAATAPFASPRDAIRGRHRLLLRGPQDRGHRPRHVGAREPDAGAAAAAVAAPAWSTRRGSARSSSASSRGSASSAPAPSRRSASCRAATSRRCCSPAGCA